MAEPVENMDVTNSEITFDNLTILKEFSNIVNLVRNEDFLEIVPKAKIRRVKWAPMFNCLKQGILDEMVQEFSSMWDYENMPEKLETLEKQKEKFAEINPELPVWRPELANVKAQLRAADVANLKKQKLLLENLAKEYEIRVDTLKKKLTAKRGYLKALQMDIQQYQKKNEDFITKISDKIENHSKLVETIVPNKLNVNEINWSENCYNIDPE